jgi:hypothetical protein
MDVSQNKKENFTGILNENYHTVKFLESKPAASSINLESIVSGYAGTNFEISAIFNMFSKLDSWIIALSLNMRFLAVY